MIDRRELLQFVSLGALYPGVAAAQHHCAAELAPKPYVPRFFTAEEHARLVELMEAIIPADEHSPGAREARTADFADWMISHSSADFQKQWREGLKLIDVGRMAEASANEAQPANERDRFFVRLKAMTVDGYYTSEIGIHKDLGYEGNQYVVKYEGCTHAEHKE